MNSRKGGYLLSERSAVFGLMKERGTCQLSIDLPLLAAGEKIKKEIQRFSPGGAFFYSEKRRKEGNKTADRCQGKDNDSFKDRTGEGTREGNPCVRYDVGREKTQQGRRRKELGKGF